MARRKLMNSRTSSLRSTKRAIASLRHRNVVRRFCHFVGAPSIDGSVKEGLRFKTTPLMIAEGISKGLAKACIVAKVDGKLWDLFRPFDGDADLVLLKWDSDKAKEVFWHSSSHVLGQSMERYVMIDGVIG